MLLKPVLAPLGAAPSHPPNIQPRSACSICPKDQDWLPPSTPVSHLHRLDGDACQPLGSEVGLVRRPCSSCTSRNLQEANLSARVAGVRPLVCQHCSHPLHPPHLHNFTSPRSTSGCPVPGALLRASAAAAAGVRSSECQAGPGSQGPRAAV